jgi:hypothetical protein
MVSPQAKGQPEKTPFANGGGHILLRASVQKAVVWGLVEKKILSSSYSAFQVED